MFFCFFAFPWDFCHPRDPQDPPPSASFVQVGVSMSPEEADRLGLKPFGDGGAENETSPWLGLVGECSECGWGGDFKKTYFYHLENI